MPAKGTSMKKLTQLLRLHFESKLTTRPIAKSLGLSVGVINKYINLALNKGLSWPLPDGLNEKALEELLRPASSSKSSNQSKDADKINFSKIHQEMKLKGVTLQLLWEEYADEQENPLSYSRYCYHYRMYKKSLKRSMRQIHKAGDKTFIDYSGVTFDIIDPQTNNIRAAEIFVGVLGASKYTYAEATWTQQLHDFLGSQQRMFEFFGGVSALLVPDNLRSAISKTCRYEPDTNPTYAQFAEHYGVAVLPARPYTPQDKASVESGVQLVQRWILARLRHQTFVGLAELNAEIRRLIKILNQKPFQKLPGNRESAFLEIDKPALKRLPEVAYQYRQYKAARVGVDYHVALNGHYYSVPHRYCGELLDLWFNQHLVECYFQGEKIATHPYSQIQGANSTRVQHMPQNHQKHSELSKERFMRWAEEIGISTQLAVENIFKDKPHIEQAYRACLGLLSLSKKYGAKRLEQACTYGIEKGVFSRKSILSILENNLDQATGIGEAHCVQRAFSAMHENIRGSQYYH